jgi:hypothetical protein
MFSTLGGALFLFTFYNLTEYTAARSGAEQAARRAARCLSPSDPECKSVVPNGVAGNPIATWFGYQPSFGPTSVTVDTFRYTGEVTEDLYGAEYNSYEVNTANHQLVWEEEEVRPQRYVGLLNSYANLMADVSIYVAPVSGGPEKVCRLNGVVNLPAGIALHSFKAGGLVLVHGLLLLRDVVMYQMVFGAYLKELIEIIPIVHCLFPILGVQEIHPGCFLVDLQYVILLLKRHQSH